jgi:hypothetical protein
VAPAAVGGFFVVAEDGLDPNNAGGLDAELQGLLSLPCSEILVVILASGFITFGIHCEFLSRYAW